MPHPRVLHLLLILVPSLLCISSAHAEIHRCVGPGGTDVFTDQPCAGLSMPSRDMRGTQSPSDSTSASASLPGSGSRGLVAGCPAPSGEALLALFETGLARRDVNYLSGLFLWSETSETSGRAATANLRRLVERELIEIRLLPQVDDRTAYLVAPADWDPYVDPPPALPEPTALAIRHVARGSEYSDGEETLFAIRRSDECLWLTF